MDFKRKYGLTFALAALLVSAVGLAVPHLHLQSSNAVHINVCIISAIISLFSGILALVRYYAKKICPFLWIGTAFLGNSIIEFYYVYSFSSFENLSIHTSLPLFMVWGWWLGRIYLSVSLACSFFTCRKTASSGELVKNEIFAYSFSAILLVICLALLSGVSLPQIVTQATLSRPLELAPAVILLLPLAGFLHQNIWKNSSFFYWLILGIIICLSVQLFLIPFSGRILDARFLLSNVFRIIAHIMVITGLLSEVYISYRDSEERAGRLTILQLMISQIRDYALFMLDTEGYIQSWNKGAEFIKGYTEKEIIGRHFSVFYSRAEVESGKPAEELRDAKEKGRFEDEGWRIRKDGSRFWANVIITPIYNSSNEHVGFSKITRDLTERKRMEEELRKQNTLLMQSNEQLEQYAYIATHDLREPLRSIASFTQLLIRKVQDNEGAAIYSGFISKAVNRTRELIDGLRMYSKIGAEGITPEKADLNDALQGALTLLEKRITETQAVIASEPLPRAKIVSSQFMYLFLHLLDNAIKYAKPGVRPHIDIKCTKSEREYIISIADNGIGIPMEYQDKVFSLFQKLQKDDHSGIGIGLAICKKVMSLHGGNIWFTATESGTTFYISLPVSQD
jgi:PAS domain S-box-containing protein